MATHNCINYNCVDPLPAHVLNDCGELVLGGIPGMLLLECNSLLTDPSNATQVAAEIAAGRAKLVNGVMASIEAASPKTITPNNSCAVPRVVGYDRTGTIKDDNFNALSIDFYNEVFAGRKFGGIVLNLEGTVGSTAGHRVLWIDAAVVFEGSPIVPPGCDNQAFFDGKFSWKKITSPSMHAAPVGIFA